MNDAERRVITITADEAEPLLKSLESAIEVLCQTAPLDDDYDPDDYEFMDRLRELKTRLREIVPAQADHRDR